MDLMGGKDVDPPGGIKWMKKKKNEVDLMGKKSIDLIGRITWIQGMEN